MREEVKKSVSLALFLCLAGIFGINWTLYDYQQEKDLRRSRQEALEVQKRDINQPTDGELSVRHFQEMLVPDENRNQEMTSRQTKTAVRPYIISASAICLAEGAAVFAWWPLLQIIHLFSSKFRKRGISFSAIFRSHNSKANSNQSKPFGKTKLQETSQPGTQSIVRKESRVDDADLEAMRSNVDMLDQLESTIHRIRTSGYLENHLKLQNLFQSQSQNFEKQVDELKEIAHAIKEITVEHSTSSGAANKDLLEQIMAIREYVSNQQQKIEKLQDGYDWNIIRNFCLKCIHCIDNIEERISRLSEQGVEINILQEIRDELIFALESSSIEKYEPEIHSQYSGQEKTAEAIKERQFTDDPAIKGKIAEVIRPGYRYILDDEKTKIVRPARVKLFGCISSKE